MGEAKYILHLFKFLLLNLETTEKSFIKTFFNNNNNRNHEFRHAHDPAAYGRRRRRWLRRRSFRLRRRIQDPRSRSDSDHGYSGDAGTPPRRPTSAGGFGGQMERASGQDSDDDAAQHAGRSRALPAADGTQGGFSSVSSTVSALASRGVGRLDRK